MPPNNRLAPPVQNAFGAPPTFAGMQAAQNAPNRGPAYTTSDRLDDVSRGLGTGFTNVLQGNADLARALFTDPKALAAQLAQAAISLGAHPSKIPGMVSNAMHNMWSQASSSPEGLGEVVGANIDPRNWLKPRKGPLMAGIFVGSKSKTWNSNAAAAAVQMETKGVSPEKIWDATGTWRGPDGNLRQEISDKAAKWTATTNNGPATTMLEHPELYQAYPDLANLEVNAVTPRGSEGAYRPGVKERIEVGSKNPQSTAIHEMQHAVQERENFSKGGTPFSTEKAPDPSLSRNLFSDFSEKMNRYMDLRRLLPSEQRPRVGAAINWHTHDFDIDELFGQVEDKVADPAIRKEMLNIVGELDSKRQNTFGANYDLKRDFEMQNNYLKLAGEAEARATEARAGMNAAERRKRFPGLDYDVPMSELTK